MIKHLTVLRMIISLLVVCLALPFAVGCNSGAGGDGTTAAPGGVTTDASGSGMPSVTTSIYEGTPELFENDGTVIEIGGAKYTVRQATVWATGDITMRRGPGVGEESVGVMSASSSAERISIGDNGWSRIVFGKEVVYVPSEYLSETEPAATSAITTAAGTGISYKRGDIVVAIDPGHQGKGMTDKEPNGPGSTEMKAKVTSGTTGSATKIPEHVLNLEVALLLRDELLKRGYSVLMIRESADVSISNAERAELANSVNADVFVRIHANGSTNTTARGALTMCQTAKNPYNADQYAASYALSLAVLNAFCTSTGISKRSVSETDTMTGINWCRVPATIVEMGFMSNPDEDRLMATSEFKNNAAKGIADGIDAYIASRK